MKIGIIGNSHIGSLKSAYVQQQLSGADVTFWAATGRAFELLDVVEDRIVSPLPDYSLAVSEGRCREFDPKTFDAVICYGCAINLPRITGQLAREIFMQRGLSSRFRELALNDSLQNWWSNLAFVRIVGTITKQAPITLMYTAPMNAVGGKPYDNADAATNTLHALREFIRIKCEELGIVYRHQPEETLDGLLYTRSQYAVGSMKPIGSTPYPEDDFVHMNAEYGRFIWNDIEHVLGIKAATAA